MAFFPVVIPEPSKVKSAHRPTPASDAHPWKTTRKRRKRKSTVTNRKVPKITTARAMAMARKFTSPDGGGAHE